MNEASKPENREATLKAVVEHMAQNPKTPKRTLSRKFQVSIYRLEKWSAEGKVKLYSAPLGSGRWRSYNTLGPKK